MLPPSIFYKRRLFVYLLLFLILSPSYLWLGANEEEEPKLSAPTEDYYRGITATGASLYFPQTTKIWAGGDVMFNWGVRDSIREDDPLYSFRSFQPILKQMDFSVVNLETPVLRKKPSVDKLKSYVFYAEESNLDILKQIGIQGVFLGNNHSMDFGALGLAETRALLSEKKFYFAGAGKSALEASLPFSWKKNQTEFHFYSASEIGEKRLFAEGTSAGVNPLSLSTLMSDRRKRSSGKVSILSLHWGLEYSPDPTETQRKIAKELIQSGFKVILGHHPHVPQGIEVFPGGAVIYSLGNFFFGSKNLYLKHNVSVVLHFNEQKLVAIEVIPVFGKHQEVSGEQYFEPLSPLVSEEFLKEYSLQCEKLGTELVIKGGRGYVFLEKDRKTNDKKN